MLKSCCNCKYYSAGNYGDDRCYNPKFANYDTQKLRTTHPCPIDVHPFPTIEECKNFEISFLSKLSNFTFPLRLWLYKKRNSLN